jgi:hypothetical protein
VKHEGKHEARTSKTEARKGHTLAIVVIEAVFQAPMFALNIIAPLNACGPSHTLSKSLRTLVCAKNTPGMREARRNERSPAGTRMMRRLDRGKPERDSVLSLVHTYRNQ